MTAAIPTADVTASSRVLLVDDEPNVLNALRRLLRGHGFEIATAANGDEALALLRRQPVDAIVCDMRMPGMNGAEVLRESRALAPDAVRVLLTGYADIGSAVQAVNEGEIFRYLAKPWDDAFLLQVLRDGLARKALERERDALVALTEQQNEQLRRFSAGLEEQVARRTLELEATVAELRKRTERLGSDFSSTVRLLSSLIEHRAGLTARCPSRVARHLRALGPALGLVGEALHDLSVAALLQDLGKLALPDALVREPLEALDSEARNRVLRHPQIGEISLMALPSLRGAGTILGRVNEHFDGSGVPGETRGEAIPLGARVLKVVSDFEQYQAGAIELDALTREQAFRRIRQFRGTRYDPQVVDVFLKTMDQPVVGPARKVLISSANLHAGMRLALDLVSASGSLLLGQGCVLDQGMIAHLRRLEEFSGEFLWIAVRSDDGHEVRVASE
ncbi:HD domain-containing phosphohydrolase [Piscinibacter sp.]|jgi:response regulator RpfG family c-di-GMP phosphodiesterase|uniref:HD domain-containing phosphohydrolase n=1 Tax=Piscinibacter sp. TaxID=1903157 RepID=UPI002F41C76D